MFVGLTLIYCERVHFVRIRIYSNFLRVYIYIYIYKVFQLISAYTRSPFARV